MIDMNFMKGNLLIITKMDMEDALNQVAVTIKVSGKMIKNKAKEFKSIQTEKFIKENL